MPNNPIVFIKVQDADTVWENGRHLFALLNAFSLANYEIHLCESVLLLLREIFGPDPEYFPPPAKLALQCENLSIVSAPPAESERAYYIYDKLDRLVHRKRWQKSIRIRFDLFSKYRFSKAMIMPYPVHPIHAGRKLESLTAFLRQKERHVRVLFAGDSEGYRRQWVHYPRTKLSRGLVLEAIHERMPNEIAHIGGEGELENSAHDYLKKIAIFGKNARIRWDNWMPTIARSDFFLCPPGIVMPMCHNVIEAMSVGTIPIINYADWLTPNLKHMENCIEFGEADDLIEKLEFVLEIPPARIAELRENVTTYYERYLNPVAFIRRIEQSVEDEITVLIHAEKNVSRRISKLSSNSVLVRGDSATGKLMFLKKYFSLPRY